MVKAIEIALGARQISNEKTAILREVVRDRLGRFSTIRCTKTHDACNEVIECPWCEITNKAINR